MTRGKPLRAFIAAQATVDTTVLRRLLDADGVATDDAFSIAAGEDVIAAIVKRIRQADLMIAVVAESGWSAYEIGVADALGKPVLVIQSGDAQVPSVIARRQVLRGALADTDVLRLTLRKVIDDVRKNPRRLVSRSSSRSQRERPAAGLRQLAAQIRDARASASAAEVEALAFQVLQSSGVTVAAQAPQNRDRGVDFAVIADALTASIGGSLLVELKAGKLTSERLRSAEAHLVQAMHATGGALGLVLYLDVDGRRFGGQKWETPFVLRFDLEDFAEALVERSFADIVVQQRNRLVHGVG